MKKILKEFLCEILIRVIKFLKMGGDSVLHSLESRKFAVFLIFYFLIVFIMEEMESPIPHHLIAVSLSVAPFAFLPVCNSGVCDSMWNFVIGK